MTKTLSILITAPPGEAEAIAGELVRFILRETPAYVTHCESLPALAPAGVKLLAYFPNNFGRRPTREKTN